MEHAVNQSTLGLIIETRCPHCRQLVTLVGQWSPRAKIYVCADCSRLHPFPIDLLYVTADGRLGQRIADNDDAERLFSADKLLDTCKKRLPLQSEPMRFNYSFQMHFPICQRCGDVHNNRTFNDIPDDYCQRCRAELAVESMWRMYQAQKSVRGTDMEDHLDTLYRTRRDLFDIGVLPDYWFQVARRSENK